MFASYLDIHLDIDNRRRLKTKLYEKRGYDFPFQIVNIPFISSNIQNRRRNQKGAI
jgi:hypothetical protein